eukprot:920497-Pyramimonas_sp.AAC.1
MIYRRSSWSDSGSPHPSSYPCYQTQCEEDFVPWMHWPSLPEGSGRSSFRNCRAPDQTRMFPLFSARPCAKQRC